MGMKFVVILLLCASACCLPVKEATKPFEDLLQHIFEADLQENDIGFDKQPEINALGSDFEDFVEDLQEPKETENALILGENTKGRETPKNEDITSYPPEDKTEKANAETDIKPEFGPEADVEISSGIKTPRQSENPGTDAIVVTGQVGDITLDPMTEASYVKPTAEAENYTPGTNDPVHNKESEKEAAVETPQSTNIGKDIVTDKISIKASTKINTEKTNNTDDVLATKEAIFKNMNEQSDSLSDDTLIKLGIMKESGTPEQKPIIMPDEAEVKNILSARPNNPPEAIDIRGQFPFMNNENQDLEDTTSVMIPSDILLVEPDATDEKSAENKNSELLPEIPTTIQLDIAPQKSEIFVELPLQESDDENDSILNNSFVNPLESFPETIYIENASNIYSGSEDSGSESFTVSNGDNTVNENPYSSDNSEDLIVETPVIIPLSTLLQESGLIKNADDKDDLIYEDDLKDSTSEIPVDTSLDILSLKQDQIEKEVPDTMKEIPLITTLEILPQETDLTGKLPTEEFENTLPENPLVTPFDTLPQDPEVFKNLEKKTQSEDPTEENAVIIPMVILPQGPDPMVKSVPQEADVNKEFSLVRDDQQDLIIDNPLITPFDTRPEETNFSKSVSDKVDIRGTYQNYPLIVPLKIISQEPEEDNVPDPMLENPFITPVDTLPQEPELIDGIPISNFNGQEQISDSSETPTDAPQEKQDLLDVVPIEVNNDTPHVRDYLPSDNFDVINKMATFNMNFVPAEQGFSDINTKFTDENPSLGQESFSPSGDSEDFNIPDNSVMTKAEFMINENKVQPLQSISEMGNNFANAHTKLIPVENDDQVYTPLNIPHVGETLEQQPLIALTGMNENLYYSDGPSFVETNNPDTFTSEAMKANSDMSLGPISEINMSDYFPYKQDEEISDHVHSFGDDYYHGPTFTPSDFSRTTNPNYFEQMYHSLNERMNDNNVNPYYQDDEIPFYMNSNILQQQVDEWGNFNNFKEQNDLTSKQQQTIFSPKNHNKMTEESFEFPVYNWGRSDYFGIPLMTPIKNNEDFQDSVPEMIIEYSTKDKPLISKLLQSMMSTPPHTTDENIQFKETEPIFNDPKMFSKQEASNVPKTYSQFPFNLLKNVIGGLNPLYPSQNMNNPFQDPFMSQKSMIIIIEPDFSQADSTQTSDSTVVLPIKEKNIDEGDTTTTDNLEVGLKASDDDDLDDGILLTEFPYNVQLPYAPRHHPALYVKNLEPSTPVYDQTPIQPYRPVFEPQKYEPYSNDYYSVYSGHYNPSYSSYYSPYHHERYPASPYHPDFYTSYEFPYRGPLSFADQVFN